jgi:hypothetical protein
MHLLDPDRLDLVADLDARDDVVAVGQLTEVRVLVVQEVRIALHDKELGVVVEGRVLATRDPERPELERKVVVFARDALAAGAGALRIASLDDPVLDAMERKAVVKAAAGFRGEPLYGLRRFVRAQRERE